MRGAQPSRTRSWLCIPTPPLPSTRNKWAGLSEATQLLGQLLTPRLLTHGCGGARDRWGGAAS